MKSQSSNTFIVFLFVFLNYYNPVSVYVALFFNIMLACYILLLRRRRCIKLDFFVVGMSVFILAWSLLIMLVRLEVDYYVLGKYSRVLISTGFIFVICGGLGISANQLISVLGWIFFSHVLAISAQLVFPSLNVPMASIFGLANPVDFFGEYSSRKMGLSGSFDTASQISILSMVFFFLQYHIKQKNIYLFLMLFSFIACTMSSRAGMVLGVVLFVMFIFFHLLRTKGRGAILMLSISVAGAVVAFYLILPVLIHSFELDLIGVSPLVQTTSEYGVGGTINALTSTHLKPLDAPFIDLLFGLGYDPDGTDIGYVKLIYHLGIVGSMLILILYLYLYVRVNSVKRGGCRDINVLILSKFFILYLFVLLVMNYKSLEVYSRGSHDLLIIIFLVLISTRRLRKLSVTPDHFDKVLPHDISRARHRITCHDPGKPLA